MLGYNEEMELVKNNVKVCWINLGEGIQGDYDEDNPEDVNLLRYDVYVKRNEDESWTAVDDASYCTNVSADAEESELKKLLNVLMNEFYDILHYDTYTSVKKLGERMSWIG